MQYKIFKLTKNQLGLGQILVQIFQQLIDKTANKEK